MQMGELVAGRELDALIAEKVMGWRRKTYGDAHDFYRGTEHEYEQLSDWWDTSGQERVALDEEAICCGHIETPAFRPSTDIAAAWQVVEYMRARHFDCTIYERPEDGGWRVIFNASGGTGETVPLAICRAALAAVESD